jgi:hypothetical protein
MKQITPNTIRDRLTMLRDDWKNEIPEKIINSLDTDNRYKVRKAWFQGIMNCIWCLQELEKSGQIQFSTRLRYDIIMFSSDISSDFPRRPTTATDIRK